MRACVCECTCVHVCVRVCLCMCACLHAQTGCLCSKSYQTRQHAACVPGRCSDVIHGHLRLFVDNCSALLSAFLYVHPFLSTKLRHTERSSSSSSSVCCESVWSHARLCSRASPCDEGVSTNQGQRCSFTFPVRSLQNEDAGVHISH